MSRPSRDDRRARRFRLQRLRRRFFPVVQALEGRQLLSTAEFLGTDTTTGGDWRSAYGADGFDISQDASGTNPQLPSYAQLSINGASNYTWSTSASDVRNLQNGANNGRIAGVWYTPTTESFNLNLTDGHAHRVAFYVLDWDYQGGRSEQFEVTDTATGTVLDTEPVSGFQNGAYVTWDLLGNVTINVTNLNPSANAVVSGIFFGAAAAPDSSPASSAREFTSGTDGIDFGATSLIGGYQALATSFSFQLAAGSTTIPDHTSVTFLSQWGSAASDDTILLGYAHESSYLPYNYLFLFMADGAGNQQIWTSNSDVLHPFDGDGLWHNLVIDWNQFASGGSPTGALDAYIDGVAVSLSQAQAGSITTGLASSTAPLVLGNPFVGLSIADLGIWGRTTASAGQPVLTATDLTNLAAGDPAQIIEPYRQLDVVPITGTNPELGILGALSGSVTGAGTLVVPGPPLLPVTMLAATADDFSAFQGMAFSGTVASFTDADPAAPAGHFTATITWGDGHTSAGTITTDPQGGFLVSGSKTYATSGTYAVGVEIKDNEGDETSAWGTATVSAPASSALEFTSGSDGIDFGATSLIDGYQALATSFWFQLAAGSTTIPDHTSVTFLSQWGSAASDDTILLGYAHESSYLPYNYLFLFMADGAGNQQIWTSNSDVLHPFDGDGLWHNLVIDWNQFASGGSPTGALDVYIDGVAVSLSQAQAGSVTTGLASSAAPLVLGDPFVGLSIADFGIWGTQTASAGQGVFTSTDLANLAAGDPAQIIEPSRQLDVVPITGTNPELGILGALSGSVTGAGTSVVPGPPLQPVPAPVATVSFLGTDTTTQGNWKGTYGDDGFDLEGDPSGDNPTTPSYAGFSVSGAQTYTWAGATTDPRALQQAASGSTMGIAACWYGTAFSIDVSLTDGQPHRLAVYALDWDDTGGGRSERIDLVDDATGVVLDSQTISNFQSGVYLDWDVTGSVIIKVTNLNPNANAVLSGLFLGGTASGPTVATPATAPANPVTGTTASLSVVGADPSYLESDLTYTWTTTSVPTGASAPTFSVNGTNDAQNTTVTFHEAGTYIFQATITDPGTLTTTSSVTVTVAQTVTAIAVAPASPVVIDTATQAFTASASDQFGQTLANQPTFTWSVDSGGTGGTITTTGSYTAPTSGTGTDTVQATSDGVSGAATVTDDDLPAFNSVTAIEATAGSEFQGTLATFTENTPGFPVGQLSAEIYWGDNTHSPGTITPGSGLLTISGMHTYATASTAGYMVQIVWNNSQVIVTVHGSTSITDVTPPVAENDSYATASGQTLTIMAIAGVLANDHDSDDGTLTATRVAPAQHGMVTLNSDGSFTYTPNPGFWGLDSFSYQASDGMLVSNVATVFIGVSHGAPVANNDAYTVVHDQVLTIQGPGVLFNDTDPAGIPLTAETETTVATQQGGTVTLNADGSFTYAPPVGYHGADSFTYLASNGVLESNPATVTINVAETAPVARADTYTVPEDDSSVVYQQSVLLNDTDADGDALTAVLATGSNTQDGTLDLLPTGQFIYHPNTGYHGPDTFQYEAFDGLYFSDPVTVTINVSNQPPTVQYSSYTLPAVETTIAAGSGVLATATDPFGYPLTAAQATAPSHGALTLNPDGSFTYTAGADYTGSDSFTYTVSDGVFTSGTATVSLTIEDMPPSAGTIQPDGSTYTYAVQPGGSTSWTAAAGVLSDATDPYGYGLTATVDSPPEGNLTLNGDGSFTYTPPSTTFTGADTFTYTVSDGVYISAPATVTINVDNDEPPVPDTGAAYTYSVPPAQVLTTSSSDGLLSRATDPYGYSLTAAPVLDYSGVTETTNADGSFTYTTNANHNTLTVNPDGSFVYTPAPSFTGTDTFEYLVDDGLNDATASFTINVNSSELPTADTGAAYSYAVQPGATLTTTSDNGVLSAAFDPYGYSLTAVADPNSTNGPGTSDSDGSFTYTTAHSTLTINADGSFTYTPDPGFTGPDTFTFLAADGLNDSAPASLTIDVSASASSAGNNGGSAASGDTDDSPGDVTDPVPVAEDDSYTIAPNQTLITPIGQGVLANDTDPNGLTLTATPVQNEGVTHGTLSLQSDGLFTYTPSANFTGTDSFTYKAYDGTYTSAPATVTLTVTSDAPGGTDDGGGAFQGAGLAASSGYGGASGTSGGTNPGNITTPDNFDPTLNGPGLAGPGVYAAGSHDTGSKAAASVPTSAAAFNGAHFVASDPTSATGGPANNLALNEFGFSSPAMNLGGAPGGNDTLSSYSPSSFTNLSASIPALGYNQGGVPQLNLNPLSGSTYQSFPVGYGSSIWNNSYDDGTWSGTDVYVAESQGSPFSNVTVDSVLTTTLVFESVSNSSSFLFTESLTSYWVSDVPTTSGETTEETLSFNSSSYSYTYGSMGTDDSTGGSGSFWGGGQSDTESGTSSNFDGGLDNSTSSSSDVSQKVDSQYSGSNVWGTSVTPSTQYFLSDGIQSGSDASDVGNTSVSVAGSASETSINSWTHSSSSFDYTAGQNDVNNVNNNWGGGSGSDTYQSSSVAGTDTSNDSAADPNDYTTTAGSSTNESDHYSDTLSYDGLGNSLSVHNLSETVTGDDNSSTHTDGENTLSGYPDTSSTDHSSQDNGSGHYSVAATANDGITSIWNDTSGTGNAQASSDSAGTDTYSLSGGSSITTTTYNDGTWGSWDKQYDSGTSADGLGGSDAWDSTSQTQSDGDTLTNQSVTNIALSGTVTSLTVDSWTNGLTTSTLQGDDTTSNGVNSDWTTASSSYNNTNTWNTNDTISTSIAISGGWAGSAVTSDTWGSGNSITTGYTSTGGTGNPDNTSDSTVAESSGDSISSHNETSTTLSGLNNDSIGNSSTNDTVSETITDNDDLTTQDNLSSTTFGAAGGRSGNTSDVQNNHSFSNSSLDNGTESDNSGTSWSYNYNDQSDQTTNTSGPLYSSVVSTSSDSTHTDSGQDTTFTDDQGSDTFSAMGSVSSTGTSTQDAGSEQFGFSQDYSDAYTDQTVSHSSNDGHGHTTSSRTISHTDQGSNGWSNGVAGSDTFSMTATDPSTSDTSWDDGGENYTQDQAQTSTFGDAYTFTSTIAGGAPSTSITSIHTGGGNDTLSSGDQVGHLYGDVSVDPTTGDIDSTTGSDNYDLVKNYSDTYSNSSSGAITTHSDSGFVGATYTDQGADTDLTTTIDPDTGDVSEDNNTDNYTEDDGSTESFTDQGSVTISSNIQTSSASHTDDGSDSVSSYDQDTDVSSDASSNGLATSVTSDTTTEWDSTSDSYSDDLSDVETASAGSVSVTAISTYTDSGSDNDSTFDQGTDTSSDASADGLESDAASDTYTNTESSSDNYNDQSYDFENVANGVVASASTSDSSTDSGVDSTWSYDYGTDGTSSESEDGLESDLSADTYTNTVSSGDTTSDQSYDGESQVAGASLSATSSDSSTDSGWDSTFSYDYNTDTPSSASEDGAESDSSSVTETTTEISFDEHGDGSQYSANEAAGALVLATSSTYGSETETDASSNVDFGGSVLESPTDSGEEYVTGTFSDADTSNDSETDISSDGSENDQGTTFETQTSTSDQTQSESSTETSSGTDTFTGVIQNGTTYFGSGGYSDSSFDSTSTVDQDDSDTTTDQSGLESGSDSSTGSGTDNSGSTSQDVESLSTSGAETDPITINALDSDTSQNESDIQTSYSEGIPSAQGGTTLQVIETDSFTETDPLTSYGEVDTDNSTDTTAAGDGGTSDTSTDGSGTPVLAAFAASDGQAQGSGGSTGGGTTTQSGTLPSASPSLNEILGNLSKGGAPALSQALSGITFSLAWVEAARDQDLLTTIHGPNMLNAAGFDANPISSHSAGNDVLKGPNYQTIFSFPIQIDDRTYNVFLGPEFQIVGGTGRGGFIYKITQYKLLDVGPGRMPPAVFADTVFFSGQQADQQNMNAATLEFAASLVPGFSSVDGVRTLATEGFSWKVTFDIAADVGSLAVGGGALAKGAGKILSPTWRRFLVGAGTLAQLPAIGVSGYNLTQSNDSIEFAGNLGDVLLRLLVLKHGVLTLKSLPRVVNNSARLFGITNEEASSLGRALKAVEIDGEPAIQSVEAFGSRAGSTYRGRPPSSASDLDIYVTVKSRVVNSPAKVKQVVQDVDEIADLFSRTKGIKVNPVIELDTIAPANKRQLRGTPFIPLD